ncbi:hypothetical protein EX30DRAFT_323688 [Ascodesmis nigricans]|uniref:Actin binding protein n=1 Tax=Ascodesmis nigricans TaxID=341454 RepID=A0A4S2MK95_9PEZI|nr:hypothetical protein EX30DRAFT_323688 [Ascodesmis nigricans]
MSSLDISPEIGRSYQKIVNGPAINKPSPTYAQWAVFSVSAPLQNAFVQSSGKASTLKVHTAGEGELEELIEEFNDGKVQFAFVKVKDPNTSLPKFVLICWCGQGVPERVKGYFTGHLNAVTKVLHGYHVQVTARSDSDLTPEGIIQKVADASGAKYSSSSTDAPAPKPAAKPPVATKPVFQPTKFGTSTLPVGSRAPFRRDEKVDEDGWGADAPPVTRTQLEKVAPAYKPTKVDINALKAMSTSTTSGPSGNARESEPEKEVVKGGYQPIGKIDIAALRKGYKEERPEPVKGAYTPIDVSSIRKGASAPREPSPEPAPRPVSERMSAFNQPAQSERLTSLPKPKVAKKFGPGAPSYGTKPLTPGGFGLGSPSAVPSAPQIGAINKSGITKSPAQLWAEKKAKERGESTPPTMSPAATGSYISPVATGASASSQAREEEATTSAGGISALRNKFAGGPPISAAPPSAPKAFSPVHTGEPERAATPVGRVAMPGLPSRATEEKVEVPETVPVSIPSPPRQPRSPTPPSPEIPGSPIRIAIPVARQDDPTEIEKPEEPQVSAPVESISKVVPKEQDLHEEPASAHPQPAGGAGARATILYDYGAAEDNEINLVEGQVVTDIEMVDEDWWAGTNSAGQHGLFPSNYVELIQEEEVEQKTAPPAPAAAAAVAPAAAPRAPSPEPAAAAQPAGPSAVALYDYEATEDNEISFPEGAVITDIQFPDEDWWAGVYKGKEGLFPANYVELQQ